MGKKRGSTFWQSAWMNDQAFLFYRMWILTLAVNRFKWIGLPPTCDARYLEQTLALEGVATISTPKGASVWTSTSAVTNGTPSLYETPRSWRSFGPGGFGYEVDPSNGVLVYNTRLRSPFPTGMIDMYARRLADYDRACDINIQQQKRPWLITAPAEKVNDLVNVYKQAAGGEPAILGLKGLVTDVQVQAFGTQVPLIIGEIDDGKRRIWNDIYTFLGIENLTRKAERSIEAEVTVESVPTTIMALDQLQARRDACEQWNSAFSEKAGYEIGCVWNHDNISKLYQAMILEPVADIQGGLEHGDL